MITVGSRFSQNNWYFVERGFNFKRISNLKIQLIVFWQVAHCSKYHHFECQKIKKWTCEKISSSARTITYNRYCWFLNMTFLEYFIKITEYIFCFLFKVTEACKLYSCYLCPSKQLSLLRFVQRLNPWQKMNNPNVLFYMLR